ncbi:MAG: glycoside hydrolase family 3 N-terminal domain-containing protein [Candidatus Borkfalkia sp.]
MLKKTREILSKLSLRQKAAILTGKDCWSTLEIEEVGLPSVKMSDSPNGIRMPGCDTDVIPSACALASSFSVDTARRAGELLGSEFKNAGLDLILGPAMNLKRSPLCGRNFEYYSEDPHLSGEMAAAFVLGAQEHVGCCVKHFAMNNQETRRMSVDSVADERTMHEMYLSPFRTVVEKASPVSMMSSYNKINGVYASENKDLLVDILRKEWGFKGFVLSDWGAVNDIVASVRARMDLEMPSNPADSEKLVCAVESGELAMRQLDRACADLIDSVLRLCAMRRKKSRTYTLAERKALLCELAADCAVLLKNDGIFPVPKNKKIGVFGFFAKEPLLQGGGSAHVEHEMPVSPLDELKHIYNDVFYCETFGENGKSADFEESLRAAETCDVCLLFCGLPAAYESEGYDRASLALPSEQIEAIEAIAKINPNVAVLLMSGSAVDVS